MDQHENPSPSFINIFVLLLFAVVIAGASAVTTYVLLNTRSNEPQTIAQPTSTPIDTRPTTTDETAGWKVYRNEEYGFEMKYPLNWTITKEGSETSVNLLRFFVVAFADIIQVEKKNEQRAGEIPCTAGIYIYKNAKTLTAYDWAIEKWGRPENREGGILSAVKINNLEGLKYEFLSIGRINVLLSKNDNIIVIRTTLGSSCANLNFIFDQMLSTFKFLD
ncbi:MAG TPA: hypothetical protein VJH96_02550 [Patescibacteria group bacterium]|nr:hypothetical protein [Patescibacteria group bacterium]